MGLEALTRASGSRVLLALAQLLRRRNEPIRVRTPSVVVGEWWRGQRGPVASLLDRNRIEVDDVTRADAEAAGALLSQVRRARGDARERLLLVDAIVVAMAARRGDVIYTSDVDDLTMLRDLGHFDVKIFGV